MPRLWTRLAEENILLSLSIDICLIFWLIQRIFFMLIKHYVADHVVFAFFLENEGPYKIYVWFTFLLP